MKNTILLLLTITLTTNVFSQKKPYDQVSIDDFISETQYGSDAPDDIEIIWWVPTEYWNVVFAQDPTATKAEENEIIKMLEDFVVVIAIKGRIGTFGGVNFDTEENIKAITSVTFKGEKLEMVSEDKIAPDMANFMAMIKPMMKNMMGPMGENMQIFLFEDPVNKVVLPIDPHAENDLKFTLGSFEKEVSLPLSCLVEEKVCPDDKAEWNGKWSYCPVHGTKLAAKQ